MSLLPDIPDPFYELILQKPLQVGAPVLIFILWGWLSYKTLYTPLTEKINFENDPDAARKRWIGLLRKDSFKAFYLTIIRRLIGLTSHYSFESDLTLIELGVKPSIFTSENLSLFLIGTSLFQVTMFFFGYIFFDIGSYLGTEILNPLGIIEKLFILYYIGCQMFVYYFDIKYSRLKSDRFIYKIEGIFLTLSVMLIFLIVNYRSTNSDLIGTVFITVFFIISINFLAQLLAGEHPESLLLLLTYPLVFIIISISSKYISGNISNLYLAIFLTLSCSIGIVFLFNKHFPIIFDRIRDKYIYEKPLRFTFTYLSIITLSSIVIIYTFRNSGYYDIYFSTIVYIFTPILLSIFGWVSFSLTKFFIINIYTSKRIKKSIILFGVLDFMIMISLLLLSLYLASQIITLVNNIVCYDVIDLYALTEGMKVDSSDSDYLFLFIIITPVFLPTLIHIYLISASFVLWLPEKIRLWACDNFYLDRHARLVMWLYITIAPILAILGPILFSYFLISFLSFDYLESLLENFRFTQHYPAF